MSLESRLGMESRGMLATLIFYAVVGIVFLALLPLTDFQPQMGIIGIFSIVTAYGLFRKRNWTIWFVVILFFTATTFSVYMLYYYLPRDYLLTTSIAVYLVLTWITTAYAADKRRSLES
jgi:hypothetical protein